jgi:hypothetical protein
MGCSGARGTLIYEKNLKAKISCQTPFNSGTAAEPVFLNVYGAQESILRHQFRQPM